MDGTWTISELAERAAAALSADGSAQVSGRVRDLPNERLIRWYTTIGLVDPPLGRRGRTALYGPRHLLQLVAVKRRQAAGRSIAEIQLELAAATDATLEQVAAGAGDDGAGSAEATGPPDPEPGNAPARTAFWSTRPDVSYTSASVADDYGRPDTAEARTSVVQGVRLTPGLTLLLDVPALDGDDLAAIEAAARPLLDELRRRGLLTPAAPPAFLSADSSRRSQ
ncbi:MerR family transcriptional regulator [Actinomadura sp. KC345]|uniref:MerR family transcriptional regulator n=1 Tax=Actinomadura sp. KC345 TaxID=2530371 RepID=UPI00104FD5B0|nr:MerR family transcriptional regulator [Actinomadura sp. KC345]TDC52332.1 MerR family transcriptional regulator [Actinomadura sp. KC345]